MPLTLSPVAVAARTAAIGRMVGSVVVRDPAGAALAVLTPWETSWFSGETTAAGTVDRLDLLGHAGEWLLTDAAGPGFGGTVVDVGRVIFVDLAPLAGGLPHPPEADAPHVVTG